MAGLQGGGVTAQVAPSHVPLQLPLPHAHTDGVRGGKSGVDLLGDAARAARQMVEQYGGLQGHGEQAGLPGSVEGGGRGSEGPGVPQRVQG